MQLVISGQHINKGDYNVNGNWDRLLDRPSFRRYATQKFRSGRQGQRYLRKMVTS